MNTNESVNSQLNSTNNQLNASRCPHCGYCPHCGRANTAPYYPWYTWTYPYQYVPIVTINQPQPTNIPYWTTMQHNSTVNPGTYFTTI